MALGKADLLTVEVTPKQIKEMRNKDLESLINKTRVDCKKIVDFAERVATKIDSGFGIGQSTWSGVRYEAEEFFGLDIQYVTTSYGERSVHITYRGNDVLHISIEEKKDKIIRPTYYPGPWVPLLRAAMKNEKRYLNQYLKEMDAEKEKLNEKARKKAEKPDKWEADKEEIDKDPVKHELYFRANELSLIDYQSD